MAGGVFLDHLVLAVPDLAAGIADFADRTGVQPAPGGAHVGLGTANALVGLSGAGGAAYLEIVGPDPDQPPPGQPRPLLVDEVRGPRLVTWAVRPDDLDRTLAAARRAGYDPGEPAAMTRRTADGELLRWRLTPFTFDGSGGVVPFLIDWGAAPHPTTRDLPAVELVGLAATHPDPPSVQPALTALGVPPDLLTVAPGPLSLTAVLRTPRGELAF